jgi:hypothetical protein
MSGCRIHAFLLLLCMPLFGASSAGAAYDPVGSGETVLRLDRGFVRFLEHSGVSLEAREGARFKHAALHFPVSGGKVDPRRGRGTVLHAGALRLARGNHRFLIKDLTVKTTHRSAPLSANVGGGQLKLFNGGRLSFRRVGFGLSIAIRDLRLSAKLAIRLNHKLGLDRIFAPGAVVGSAVTRTAPATAALAEVGRLSFEPDAALVAKLDDLFVALNPIHPAEHPNSAFTFPIFDGALALDGSAGKIKDLGALELIQLGGGQIFWQELWVDFDAGSLSAEVDVSPSPPFSGKAGRIAIAALDLTSARVSPFPKSRTIAVEGVRMRLSATTAAAFNEAFAQGGGEFAPGEALGTLSFIAQGD